MFSLSVEFGFSFLSAFKCRRFKFLIHYWTLITGLVDFFIFYFQFLMLYYEAIQSTMSWISCISAQLYDFTFCFFMDFVGILHVLIEQCFFMLCCFYLTILVNLCESICCYFNALFFNIVKWLPWFILNWVSTKLMFFGKLRWWIWDSWLFVSGLWSTFLLNS